MFKNISEYNFATLLEAADSQAVTFMVTKKIRYKEDRKTKIKKILLKI